MTASLRLGLKPVRIPAALPRLRSLLPSLPSPPASYWGRDISQWGMMLNDQLGCCAIASVGHTIMVMTDGGEGSKPAVMTDAEVLAGYEEAGGYMPGQPDTDRGCVLSEVLARWQGEGFQVAGSVHKLQGWVRLEVDDLESIKFSIARMATVSAGVSMTASAMQQFMDGREWSDPGSDIEGGHAIPLVGYDADGVELVTWGRRQRASWAWWRALGMEAYCLLDEDLASAHGIDWTSLQQDMQQVQASLSA